MEVCVGISTVSSIAFRDLWNGMHITINALFNLSKELVPVHTFCIDTSATKTTLHENPETS